MPDKPTAAELAKQKPDAPEGDEFSIKLSELRDRPAFAGATAAEVAGAFHGVADSTEITVKDAKARITEWSKAKVKTENTEG